MQGLLNDIALSLDVLRKGGLILYPTDTVWGIGCDAFDEQAVSRVFRIKRRPDDRSMILLTDSMESLERYVDVPMAAKDLLAASTRSTTVIYPAPKALPAWLLAADGSVAIRIVDHPYCTPLITGLGRPIVSSSANYSGKPAPATFAEIEPGLLAEVDRVSTSFRSTETALRPSRIIRLDEMGNFETIRE